MKTAAWKTAAAVGGAALALSLVGALRDPTRFGLSYLFAFFVFLSIALGALFFVLIQHLTGAAWSVTVRRSSEFLMRGLPVFLVLVIPILLLTPRLYPWDGASRAPEPMQAGAFANASDEGDREPAALAAANRDAVAALDRARQEENAHILAARKPYMNRPFFAVRALGFLALWTFLAMRYFRLSTRQDGFRVDAGEARPAQRASLRARAAQNTVKAERFAPIATVLLSVTVAFAAFDWLMSLEPFWYSTIFGVYVFAGCAAGHAAALALLVAARQRRGALRDYVSVEHYHDLGKFLFGWLSFWAYIAFCQFFLIWYANVPDEVSFFHRRWTDNLGTWKPVSLSLFALHFLVPFWLLLSRNAKRRVALLTTGAVVVLGLHVVDIYWLVLPNAGPLAVSWLDVTCLLGVGGVYAAVVLRAMGAHAAVPVGDPRLSASLAFENT